MSIVNWEKVEYYRCPHCRGVLEVETQDSEGYGTNSFLINPLDGGFCEEINENVAKKEIEDTQSKSCAKSEERK